MLKNCPYNEQLDIMDELAYIWWVHNSESLLYIVNGNIRIGDMLLSSQVDSKSE